MHRVQGMLERAWLLRTGNPPRALEDYHPLTLRALLLYGKESDAELNRIARSAGQDDDEAWIARQERTLGQRVNEPAKTKGIPTGKTGWDEPILTGDPVADEWEKMIARGELPDWMKPDAD